jgi:hypothetical protein
MLADNPTFWFLLWFGCWFTLVLVLVEHAR